jgi:glucose-6-phosphate isomerase
MDTFLGACLSDVEAAAEEITRNNIISRIWQKDHTVWQDKPDEITNRLGWLTISDLMREQPPVLNSFAQEMHGNFRHVVLLGMGGSSLGAEVVRQVLGDDSKYPEIVLDSSLPESVQATASAIDPARSLFLVSSKSGTTIETVSLFNYFRGLVQSIAGREQAGQNFVAITDPDTPLAKTSEKEFRRAFLNQPDIGGRYSVLSYFGIIPALLAGVNIATLLDRADRVRKLCRVETQLSNNPGAWLGIVMGALAQKGYDKLTLITSPAISSFGLWLEQLIAESLGKNGKGILPVAGEPLVPPDFYGNDRLFVYLRMENDDNSTTDKLVEQLKARERPLVVIKLRDRYDIGSEFYRWEFATAIAGSILKVNPFDQPDVESSKKATQSLLHEYISTGQFPTWDKTEPFTDLLTRVRDGMYLAILAYVQQTAETDKILGQLRYRIMEKYHIATTLGYGPRYLHSTGQLHKGGAANGLFLQITTAHGKDVPIPGMPYTFGVLADSEALGDLRALRSLGRHVCSIHLTKGISEISQLSHALETG